MIAIYPQCRTLISGLSTKTTSRSAQHYFGTVYYTNLDQAIFLRLKASHLHQSNILSSSPYPLSSAPRCSPHSMVLCFRLPICGSHYQQYYLGLLKEFLTPAIFFYVLTSRTWGRSAARHLCRRNTNGLGRRIQKQYNFALIIFILYCIIRK